TAHGAAPPEPYALSLHDALPICPDVTAVFAASDEMAMGAILAARDRGLRVPEDLSVVGGDGHDLGGLVGLTTIAQDAYQQGFDAALLLLDMINGAPVPESLTYPPELVRRRSTAPPRPVA